MTFPKQTFVKILEEKHKIRVGYTQLLRLERDGLVLNKPTNVTYFGGRIVPRYTERDVNRFARLLKTLEKQNKARPYVNSEGIKRYIKIGL